MEFEEVKFSADDGKWAMPLSFPFRRGQIGGMNIFGAARRELGKKEENFHSFFLDSFARNNYEAITKLE